MAPCAALLSFSLLGRFAAAPAATTDVCHVTLDLDAFCLRGLTGCQMLWPDRSCIAASCDVVRARPRHALAFSAPQRFPWPRDDSSRRRLTFHIFLPAVSPTFELQGLLLIAGTHEIDGGMEREQVAEKAFAEGRGVETTVVGGYSRRASLALSSMIGMALKRSCDCFRLTKKLLLMSLSEYGSFLWFFRKGG